MRAARWNYNEDAEMSVVGGVMLSPDSAMPKAQVLIAQDFAMPKHQAIWAAILKLHDSGEPIDLVTLSEALNASGDLDGVGGVPYLTDLSLYVPSAANIGSYVSIVKGRSQRRALAEAAQKIADMVSDLDHDDQALRADAMSQLAAVAPLGERSLSESSRELAVEAFERVERKSRGEDRGISINVPSFDSAVGGLFASELTLIGGRPGTGKTAFALHIAQAAAHRGKRVLFITREMSGELLISRLLSRNSGVSGTNMRTGNVTIDEFERLNRAMAHLGELPLWTSSQAKTPREIADACQHLAENGGIDLLIIDYVQLIKPDRELANRNLEVASISWALKSLCLEYKIPVVALSQLSRSNREGRPVLADLRDSGALEQDADNVIFLYDDGRVSADTRSVKLCVSKQRNGETCELTLLFTPKIMKFQDRSVASVQANATA